MTSHRLPPPTFAGRTVIVRLFAVVVVGLASSLVLAESPHPDPPANDTKRFAFDKDRKYLSRVRDFQPFRIGGLEPGAWVDDEPFTDLVFHANQFTGDELLSAARKDVSYWDLMTKDDLLREDYRFELVRIDGKLKRLQRMGGGTPRLHEGGIDTLYQAWIFPTGGRGTDPVCVVLSEPPEGVEPALDITPGVPVTTAGYFYKIVEYQSNEPNPKDSTRTLYHRAPLLVGRSAVVTREPAVGPSSVTGLLTVSLVLGGAVLVGLFALTYWLRRTDAGSRRVNALRRKNPYTAPEPTPEPPADTPTG